jgi:hypothetical protein
MHQPAYFRGHPSVTAGLTDGLDQLGFKYNIDVSRCSMIGDHVHVLSGFEAFRFALDLKKKGKIDRLTIGPNVAVSSADENGIIASPLVDKIIVPSQWVLDAYIEDNPAVANRMGIWYSGINIEYWKMKEHPLVSSPKRCLLYLKYPQKKLVEACIALLNKHHIEYDTIRYGDYNKERLREKLQNSDFAIVFSATETQGIALFEMWASNTPTFVWNQGNYQYKLQNYAASGAPYLTPQTGCFFRDADELEKLLISHKDMTLFSPQKWVEQYGSNELSARNFLKVIDYNDD